MKATLEATDDLPAVHAETESRPLVVHAADPEASKRVRLERWSGILGDGRAPTRAFGGGTAIVVNPQRPR